MEALRGKIIGPGIPGIPDCSVLESVPVGWPVTSGEVCLDGAGSARSSPIQNFGGVGLASYPQCEHHNDPSSDLCVARLSTRLRILVRRQILTSRQRFRDADLAGFDIPDADLA